MAWTEKYIDLTDGGSGDGSSGDPWASYGEAVSELGALAGPTKIYVRGDGTLSGALAFSNDGTSANPILWVGCTGTGATWTPIGNDASATKPNLTCDTYQVTVTGDYQTFDGLAFTGSVTTAGGLVNNTSAGVNCTFIRCRFTSTANNANSRALGVSGQGSVAVACFMSCATSGTAPTACVYLGGVGSTCFGCHIKGGESGVQIGASASILAYCLIEAVDSNSGVITDSLCTIINNTIYGAGADGIRATSTGTVCFIANNLIHSATGVAISNSAGDSCGLRTFANLWYNCGTNGVTGNPEDFEFYNTGTASADPLPNISDPANSTTDFDLAISQQRLAFPGTFEAGAYAFVGRMSHGAVQPLPGFPSTGNVHNDDTVDGATGTLTLPTAAQVESGVTFGAGGTEFTGTMSAGGGGGVPVFGGSVARRV